MRNHNLKFGWLWIFFIVFTAGTIRADIPDTIQLQAVEVRAKKIVSSRKQSFSKIDSLSIGQHFSNSLADVLRLHTNVFLKSNGPGGLTTASLRGTKASHTAVLWNGFPVNGPQLGQVDFSTIPVYFMDQIHIMSGGHGGNRAGGLGGTVSIDLKTDFTDQATVGFLQSTGSFKTAGTFGTFAYSTKRFIVKTRLFRKSSQNDFRYLNNASWPQQWMKQRNAGYKDNGFLQEFHFNFGNSLISFASWNQWNDRNLPPIMTNLEQGGNPKEFQNNRFHRHYLAYKYFWHNGKLELKSSYNIENQRYYLHTTTAFEPYQTVSLINSRNASDTWMNSLWISHRMRPGVLLHMQSSFDKELVITNNYLSPKKRQQFSILLRSEFEFSENLHSGIGMRYDWIDNKAKGLRPTFDISYRPQFLQALNLKMAVTKNVRNPSMNDLHWHPGGDENLKPETGLMSEFVVSWEPKWDFAEPKFQLSAYYTDVTDWIQWRPTSSRYWTPENIARVKARGLEANQRLKFARNALQIQLNSNFAYTVTTDESPMAQFENASGKQLIYIPKLHGNLMLHMVYKALLWRYHIDYTGVRFTSIDRDDDFLGLLPAHILHDMALGYQFENWTATFKVNNVFNTSYQAVLWRPMPGRSIEINIEYLYKKSISHKSNSSKK